MDRPLRIAMFVGMFPVVSETFILRQITGLLDLGHVVDVFADTRVEPGSPQHPEVEKYRLLRRTTFMDMPPETAPYEMPVWPIAGRTWPPGSPT
jgi:colanic acid/amylovoran biosynthesis glycosyltransferase